eukprot:scaffold10517_cov56-Attheya_sp.AAC.1
MEACWGAPSFFSLHPVGVYKGIGTVSELITQSAYLVRRIDTDCRKQYLVLLFDPGSGAGSAGSSCKLIQFVVKNYLIYLEKKGCLPKFNYDPYVIIV